MDKKAKKILFSTFWKNGWIDSRHRALSDADFEYAKSAGLMFDPVPMSHDECINAIVSLVSDISKEQVVSSFLSSLSSRRLDWRSPLASYAIAKTIPEHKYTPVISGTSYTNGKPTSHSYACGKCNGSNNYDGAHINVLNFERIKWGGVRHGEIFYTYFDLSQLIHADIPEPTDEDLDIFKKILNIIDSSEPTDYPGALEKKLATVVKSNESERQMLIEILASVGVLRPGSYDRPARGKSDWVFAQYWRGEDKYCRKTVDEYFGKVFQSIQ